MMSVIVQLLQLLLSIAMPLALQSFIQDLQYVRLFSTQFTQAYPIQSCLSTNVLDTSILRQGLCP